MQSSIVLCTILIYAVDVHVDEDVDEHVHVGIHTYTRTAHIMFNLPYLHLHDREFLVCISSAILIQSGVRSGVLRPIAISYFATSSISFWSSSLVHRMDAFSTGSGFDLGFDLHDLGFAVFVFKEDEEER